MERILLPLLANECSVSLFRDNALKSISMEEFWYRVYCKTLIIVNFGCGVFEIVEIVKEKEKCSVIGNCLLSYSYHRWREWGRGQGSNLGPWKCEKNAHFGLYFQSYEIFQPKKPQTKFFRSGFRKGRLLDKKCSVLHPSPSRLSQKKERLSPITSMVTLALP